MDGFDTILYEDPDIVGSTRIKSLELPRSPFSLAVLGLLELEGRRLS